MKTRIHGADNLDHSGAQTEGDVWKEITSTELPGNKRGLDVSLGGSSAETIRWDDTSTASTIYVGFAAPGSATSSAVWRIMRVNTSTKAVTFADGDDSYDNIYDNRTGLSYS